MAQRSGFFNALNIGGVYDKKYNAEDYSDNLAIVISNGVLRSNADDLKVTASGLNISVNAGHGWIKGKWYVNDSAYAIQTVSPPLSNSRIDRVVLRYDISLSVRNISLQYIQGTAAASPVAPALTRNDTVYDLCLAEINVNAGATAVTITDTRGDADLCGWVYSVSGDGSFFTSLDNSFNEWFADVRNELATVTLFRRHEWETTLSAAGTQVQFNVPEYDEDTCFVEVYINGMLTYDYTLASDVITFTDTLTAGTVVTVLVYESVDGSVYQTPEGIASVESQLEDLEDKYETISGAGKYIYVASGLNDNVSLSQIAEAIYSGSMDNVDDENAEAFLNALGGNNYLEALESDAKITIEVVGTLGASNPVTNNNTYFNFSNSPQTRKIIFDFAKADRLNITCAASTSNYIFFITDVDIKNLYATITSAGADCNIQMFANGNTGTSTFDNCETIINATGNAIIGTNGTFINCKGNITSQAGKAYCFYPKTSSLVRIIGGEYLAYRQGSDESAIIYCDAIETNPVAIMESASCPERAVTNYEQDYVAMCYHGVTVLNMIISPLDNEGSYITEVNRINLSK